MGDVPHVALLIETSREYARGLLRGVARYHQEHGPWSIFFEPHGLDDPPPVWLKTWRGDGILARIDNQRMADAVLQTGIPAVDVRGAIPGLGLPFIGVDNRPVARLAFDHLRNCGLGNFAFCGLPRGANPPQDLRGDYFVQLVEEAGFECHVLLGPGRRRRAPDWERSQQETAAWLRTLPKPVGIMTCHDDRGNQVIEACRRAGLRVPDDAAVIGVDNDPLLCNLCTPPLTSIDINSPQIGYDAAAQLAALMAGGKPPSQPVLMGQPRGVAARRSTDMLAIDDEEVASALRFVHENATKGITVQDVLARAARSPTTLERRVKRLLGRTIKAEITRVKLTRARLLLCETELSVARIAERCGFSEARYFCGVFRSNEGMTATAYRKGFRE
ncbi:MAG TPA: XylR family transcriptional regulator [Lacipirellulaceae bacterium]|nr:XylR family transcriptional regulator [Lacipirellulaceae bacterium]